MHIVGISAGYHESACCLLRDGVLVAAAEEERFSRVKHDPRLPLAALRFCLERGGIAIDRVDALAYYESPVKKLARQLWAGQAVQLSDLDAGRVERDLRERTGFAGRILTFEHHQSHAASSFFYSGFQEAAVLTVDGVGEWATTTYGRGHGSELAIFEEVHFPHSLGLLYSTITSFLGFRVNDGEYKVMGLAPYGKPTYLDALRRLVRLGRRGQFALDMRYFDFASGGRMHSDALCGLLAMPARAPGEELSDGHRDLARSLQLLLEEVLLAKVRYLAREVASPNLCLAGGVALNCVANRRILDEGPFENLFVQPAAGDSGTCLGAAALAHVALTGERPAGGRLEQVYLGPAFGAGSIGGLLAAAGVAAQDFAGREAELLAAVVERLVGGEVVGWFQDRMEFGPRALGARSILADPRRPEVRDRVNRLIKKREDFRPFAPSVLLEHAPAHFALGHPSPFMLETCPVRSALELPGITHVDGSARPQTVDRRHLPRYAALLDAFHRRTGCPILLNTSFNVDGEPIVCTPEDALRSMAAARLDALVLCDYLVGLEAVPAAWAELPPPAASAIVHWTYTFI
ncbi:MAG TPA: carbamoyltransferase N-terminal domain-containing protein [Thermoanaerobaculia bacterium]|nr:carbamoyltransferase N-terminal domain-containing protein [Thermoanaerobaculia bacterium]